jgi:hypothetical protein
MWRISQKSDICPTLVWMWGHDQIHHMQISHVSFLDHKCSRIRKWYSNSRSSYVTFYHCEEAQVNVTKSYNHCISTKLWRTFTMKFVFQLCLTYKVKEYMLWKFFHFNSEMLIDLSSNLHFNPKKMLFRLS